MIVIVAMYVKMLFSLGSKLGFHVSKFPLQPIFFFMELNVI